LSAHWEVYIQVFKHLGTTLGQLAAGLVDEGVAEDVTGLATLEDSTDETDDEGTEAELLDSTAELVETTELLDLDSTALLDLDSTELVEAAEVVVGPATLLEVLDSTGVDEETEALVETATLLELLAAELLETAADELGVLLTAEELVVTAAELVVLTAGTLVAEVEAEPQLKLMLWMDMVQGLVAVEGWTKLTEVAPPHWLLGTSLPPEEQRTVFLQTEESGMW